MCCIIYYSLAYFFSIQQHIIPIEEIYIDVYTKPKMIFQKIYRIET